METFYIAEKGFEAFVPEYSKVDGKPFKLFEANRDAWVIETAYVYPGAIQYYGPAEVCDITTKTLALEKE